MSTVREKINNALTLFWAKISTVLIRKANIVDNCVSTSTEYPLSANQGTQLQTQIDELNSNLNKKITKDSYASLMNLIINASQYPTLSFHVNGTKTSSIFDYGSSLTLRQYDSDGGYTEIQYPELYKVKTNTSDITSLKTQIGNAMLYKGYITDGLLQTVGTGIYLYDSADSTNIPVAAGTGVIFSFNLGTTLCYRLCITSASGIYYSVYIPGSTYGTWKHLAVD